MSKSPTAKNTAANRKIFAVGGAKGGVGKSLMAANLGVYLAGHGHRTVIIDLDLGAANLHLYLGLWALEHRVNDFLDKKVEALESITVATEYGPSLIGGGSSRLGSANLPFARKLKLMRAIRKIDADYIILDLGADTSYNILDFFLLADCGLVMTTCDPAAYLDAYTFIKMALYRRLARLFGVESVYRKFKDEELQAVIQAFVSQNGPDTQRHITDLMDQISKYAPQRKYLVQEAIAGFQPNLIVNMVENKEEANALIHRMQAVSERMLSVHIDCLGTIPADRQIAKSTHDLTPEVALHPNGVMAGCIRDMLTHL